MPVRVLDTRVIVVRKIDMGSAIMELTSIKESPKYIITNYNGYVEEKVHGAF